MNHKPPSQKQSQIIWFALTALAIFAIICVIAALVLGFGELLNLLSPVLWPLAIAAVLAYLLDPAVNWLQRRKVSRTWAIAIVFIFGLCVFGGIMASVLPQMIKETSTLISKIPAYTNQAQQSLDKWANNSSIPGAQNTNSPPAAASNNPTNFSAAPSDGAISQTNSVAGGKNIHQQIISSAKNWFGKIMPKIGDWLLNLLGKFSVLLDVAMALILIPIYTFYFLREKQEIKKHWTQYLPMRESRVKDELVFILSSVNQYMITFFRGQVMVALISGTLYTIGFFAIGLDYALLLGFIAVILVIIPFIGAIILVILAALFTAMQFHDLLHPLMIIVMFAVVQSLESFFYSPRILGNRVNLHPVVVIIALMVGITLLGGLLGGILAIPLAAALRVLLLRYVWKKSESPDSKT
ncbi:MAG TPA: AI-2E family transporter [Verrucomicrobiae bacterium]